MNGYVFFYNGKRVEILAEALYAAKLKALAHFNVRKSQEHMVHGMLAEVDGKPVIHRAE
jgi:hypothetical protein